MIVKAILDILPLPSCRTKLYEIACESWGMGDDDTRQKMSVMASAAAWGLGQWDSMEEYVRSIPKNTMEGSFYQSLLHIHHRQFTSAQKVSMWGVCVCGWVCGCVGGCVGVGVWCVGGGVECVFCCQDE